MLQPLLDFQWKTGNSYLNCGVYFIVYFTVCVCMCSESLPHIIVMLCVRIMQWVHTTSQCFTVCVSSCSKSSPHLIVMLHRICCGSCSESSAFCPHPSNCGPLWRKRPPKWPHHQQRTIVSQWHNRTANSIYYTHTVMLSSNTGHYNEPSLCNNKYYTDCGIKCLSIVVHAAAAFWVTSWCSG